MTFKDIADKQVAVNCETEEEANQFVKFAYEKGYRWECGDISNTFFYEFDGYIFYTIENGYIKAHDEMYMNCYIIIRSKDFIEHYNDQSKPNIDLGVKLIEISIGLSHLERFLHQTATEICIGSKEYSKDIDFMIMSILGQCDQTREILGNMERGE